MVHPVKKMVPDPQVPDIGCSSPKCGPNEATWGWIPVLQNPSSPVLRLALQWRGQRTHGEERS